MSKIITKSQVYQLEETLSGQATKSDLPKVLTMTSFTPQEGHNISNDGVMRPVDYGITEEEYTNLKAGYYDMVVIVQTTAVVIPETTTYIGYKMSYRSAGEVSYLMFKYDANYTTMNTGYRGRIFSLRGSSYDYYNIVEADVRDELYSVTYGDTTILTALSGPLFYSGYKGFVAWYNNRMYVMTKYAEGSYMEFGYFDGGTYYWIKATRTGGTMPSSWVAIWTNGSTAIALSSDVTSLQATVDTIGANLSALQTNVNDLREEIWVARDYGNDMAGGLYPVTYPNHGNWPVNGDLTDSVAARVDAGTWRNVKIVYMHAESDTTDSPTSIVRHPNNEYIEWKIAEAYYTGDGKMYYRFFEVRHLTAFALSYGIVKR